MMQPSPSTEAGNVGTSPQQTVIGRSSNRFLRTSRVVRNLNSAMMRRSQNNRRASLPGGGAARASARSAWALQQPPKDDDEGRLSMLSQRLEEILIMELHRDGARDFLQFTVRGLYKHVMNAITAPTTPAMQPLKSSLSCVMETVPDDQAQAQEMEGDGGGGGSGGPLVGGRSVSFHEKVTIQPATSFPTPPPPKPSLSRVPTARVSVVHPPSSGGTGAGATAHEDVTYRERIGGYLHPRDMRRLVTPFSASNEPALIVRRHVMLLNFDPLRAVILRDRLLVLVPHGADSLLSQLERRVRGGTKGAEMSVFGTASEVESTVDDDDGGEEQGNDDNENAAASDRSSEDLRDNAERSKQDKDFTERNAPRTPLHERMKGGVADPPAVEPGGGEGSLVGQDGAPLSTAMRRHMDDLMHHKKPLRGPLRSKGSGGTDASGSEGGTGTADVSKGSKSSDAADANTADVVSKLAASLQGILGGAAATKGTAGATENDDTTVNSEWEEMNTRNWIDLPFELQCADAVLSVVCSILSEDAYELQEAALGYIDSVVTGKFRLGDDPLTGLRHTKDAIREMSSRIKGFVQSMNRLLDDDEDMALMNLSRLISHPERFIKPVSQFEIEEEADEPELILEAHLQIGLTLMNALDLIQGQVDSASDLVDQKLDSVRNRILFANMIITIFSLAMTTAAVVGSFFGMNVEVPYGSTEGLAPFTAIVVATMTLAAVVVVFTMAALFYSRAIPLPGASPA